MAEHADNVKVDVAVIGGGLAGLTAGATALRSGASVTIIESHSVGGRARSTERSGYILNEGGHALYHAGAAMRVLNELGVALEGGPAPFENPQLIWNGDLVPLPYNAARMARSKLLSLRSKAVAARLFAIFEKPPKDSPGLSFGDWLEQRNTPDDLSKLVLALARLGTYAATPELWSASTIIRQLGLARRGVIYVDGGWQRIVEQLRDAVTGGGGQIVQRQVVTDMTPAGQSWRISTEQYTVTVRSVILATGGPAVAAGLLGEDPGWTTAAGPVVRASCLDLAFDEVPSTMFVLGADEPLYLSRHAPAAKLAPAGHSLYSAMRYLATDDEYTTDQNRAALKGHAQVAGLGQHPTVERFLSSPIVCWGSPLATLCRPTGLEAAHRGIFAAGDWVGPNLLADASVESGALAARAAAKHALARR
ncbi:FAD-dependent oxidoreductase [soil metagenome]